ELLDGRVGQVEQGERSVWRLGCLFLRRLFLFFFFLFGRCLGLGRHASLLKARPPGNAAHHPTYRPYTLPLPYARRVEPPAGRPLAVLRPRRQPASARFGPDSFAGGRLSPD